MPQRTPRAVGEIMTAEVIAVAPDATVAEAIDMFVRHRFRHLLVAGAGRRLAGVLSDRDALRYLARGADARGATVAEIMRRDPVVAAADMPLREAIDLLRSHRINCLPVVDAGGRVLGIVTTTDLLATLHDVLGQLEAPAA
jgi:CBS domain-containing protein